MYLKSLTLKDFRSCRDTIVSFRPDLTALIGENNSGKSNIIDAIRLLTMPLNGRRDRYADEQDINRNSTSNEFTIEGQFSNLSDALKGLLISAVPDPLKDEAYFGFGYRGPIGAEVRGNFHTWAASQQHNDPETGSTGLIRHVYLPPLRDAHGELGTGSAFRITTLIKHFLEDGELESFLEHVRREEKPHKVVERINSEIGDALNTLTSGVRPQQTALSFSSDALFDVARDLRFKMADKGLDLEEIRASGMGYANLLYMATTIVELARAKEADLTLFLVEEPEAHLHPQLQGLVLDFLKDRALESSQNAVEDGNPEGRIQIILSTHSPNLTAWSSPQHLVVVRSVVEEKRTRTVTIPIAGLGLSKRSIGKVERYLDVTRSSLLFGTRVMLVEGLAESILIPVFAKKVVLKSDPAAWRVFKGATFASIDGVDFKPYIEILLSQYSGTCLAEKVVVVTDKDPDLNTNRAEQLEKLGEELGSEDKLSVRTNINTLEYDLFEAGNDELIKKAYLNLHPRSKAKWKEEIEDAEPDERPAKLMTRLKKTNTRKGDLAQEIASLVLEGEAVVIPAYIEQAITDLVSLP